MTIEDIDVLNSPELIGRFEAENFELMPSNTFQSIPLVSVNVKHRQLTVKVQIKLTCDKNYYGHHCAIKCVPDLKRFDCGPNGDRFCRPGFTGKYCEQEDSCFYESCAPYATCKNREDGTGRICLCDGQEDPKCYPGYDPCAAVPCMHDGKCHSTGHYGKSFRCDCPEAWTGHRCNIRRLACLEEAESLQSKQQFDLNVTHNSSAISAIDVCLNGGQCLEYSDRFGYRCACTEDWTGQRCEKPVVLRHASPIFHYITISLIGVFLALFVVGIVFGLIYRAFRLKCHSPGFTPRNGGIVFYHSDRDSTATFASILPTNPQIMNDVYGKVPLMDKIYEPSSNFSNQHHNDVYDECDPLGLASKAGVYSTTFESDLPEIRTQKDIGSPSGQHDESAPPLPERPRDLTQSNFSRHPSLMSMPLSEFGTSYKYDTVRSPKERRQPTVYRPLSPTFIPTSIERKSRPFVPF